MRDGQSERERERAGETGTEGKKREMETEGASGRDLAGERRGSERRGQREQQMGTEGERETDWDRRGGDGDRMNETGSERTG